MELNNTQIKNLRAHIVSECGGDEWNADKANEMAQAAGFANYFALNRVHRGVVYSELPQETKDKIQAAKERKQERKAKRKEAAKKAAATRKANAKKKAEEAKAEAKPKAKAKPKTDTDSKVKELAALLANSEVVAELTKKVG